MQHPKLGSLCFQCDLSVGGNGTVHITPRDSYKHRVYIEPLGLYIQLETGEIESVTVDLAGKKLVVGFTKASGSFTSRLIKLTKEAKSRPGADFKINSAKRSRGNFVLPATAEEATVLWSS